MEYCWFVYSYSVKLSSSDIESTGLETSRSMGSFLGAMLTGLEISTFFSEDWFQDLSLTVTQRADLEPRPPVGLPLRPVSLERGFTDNIVTSRGSTGHEQTVSWRTRGAGFLNLLPQPFLQRRYPSRQAGCQSSTEISQINPWRNKYDYFKYGDGYELSIFLLLEIVDLSLTAIIMLITLTKLKRYKFSFSQI